MPTDFTFRLSTYLTLALASLCLGYAEWDLLREAWFFTVVVIALLAGSFWMEGRYQLDIRAANRLGLGIGLLAGGWFAYQFVNSNSLIYTLPWPASLLPYLGPLLMVLMPAKMVRTKHVGDWWFMQGIALAGVGLASTMAEDEVFGILLGLYAIVGVWSVIVFFYRRTAGTLTPIPNTDPGPPPQFSASPPSGSFVTKSIQWLLLSGLLALPLFFLTPRSAAPRWQFGQTRLETGFSGEQMIDLNRTGDLVPNHEVAFEVQVTNANDQPFDQLPMDQRWRGTGFTLYDNGRWARAELPPMFTNGAIVPVRIVDYHPPTFGANQIVLKYFAQQSKAEPILAESVRWIPRQAPPVASVMTTKEIRPWWQDSDTSFSPLSPVGTRTDHYRQVMPIRGSGDVDLGTGFDLAPVYGNPSETQNGPISVYKSMRLPKLRKWVRELLNVLAEKDPALKAAMTRATDRVNYQFAAEDFETVAIAFNRYLKESGEYEYTMKLRRQDKASDPIEDFLLRTKSGHCERFAAALALMLRAVGVPTSYILGFKGHEGVGDGTYLIRQEHAHAWVEVLVYRPGRRGQPGTWHWRTFDPTPDSGADDQSTTAPTWFESVRTTGAAFFLEFIVGYNTERRKKTAEVATSSFSRYGWYFFAIPFAWGLYLVARSTKKRKTSEDLQGRVTPRIVYPWYDQLRALCQRVGVLEEPGQTGIERARLLQSYLRQRPETADLAEIPMRVTKLYYRARFADQPPDATELAQITNDLEHLQESISPTSKAMR